MELELNKTYKVKHRRKGSFTMKVTAVTSDVVSGIIVDGVAKAEMEYNVRDVGESISVDKSFCDFSEA